MDNHLISMISKHYSYMLSILLGGLTACHTDTVYHVYRPVPEEGWSKQDTLVYTLPDSLKPGCYQLEMDVRHTDNYPYRDIWLEMAFERRTPQANIPTLQEEDSLNIPEQELDVPADSMTWVRDTVHLYLADRQGRWLNGGTIGSLYQFYAPVGNFCLTNKDGKKFRIVHIMKDNPLKGIHDIGIRIYQKPSH